jgi:hypothetical protein
MTNSTPEPEQTEDLSPEAQTPTPTPASQTPDQGGPQDTNPEPDHAEGTATTPPEADSPEQADGDEVPDTEELQEPSTEKDPGEEPKAPERDEPDADHEAVGIGIVETETPESDG